MGGPHQEYESIEMKMGMKGDPIGKDRDGAAPLSPQKRGEKEWVLIRLKAELTNT
jgi:hypothetical protein